MFTFARFQLLLMTTSCSEASEGTHNNSGDPSTHRDCTCIRGSHATNRSAKIFSMRSCSCTHPSLQLRRSTFHRNRWATSLSRCMPPDACCSPAFAFIPCFHLWLLNFFFFPPSIWLYKKRSFIVYSSGNICGQYKSNLTIDL